MAEIFSKELSHTDIQAMVIPKNGFDIILKASEGRNANDNIDLKVMDETDRVWNFVCSTRNNGYPKPVLRGEWSQFVRVKQLQIGDHVTFYQDHIREFRLFGAAMQAPPFYRLEVRKREA